MTLWGETAQDKGPLLEAQDCPVITVTACRVSDYNGEASTVIWCCLVNALQLRRNCVVTACNCLKLRCNCL